MATITESSTPERDNDIVKVAQAINTTEASKQFKLSVQTIRKIVRRSKESKVYSIKLTDGLQIIPIADVVTSRGFNHACRRAIREYSATFARLELPQWRLVAGDDSIQLNAPEMSK